MSVNPSIIPKSWFVIGKSHKYRVGRVYPFQLRGKKFVVFRGENKKLNLLSAHCPHMGVNLSSGGIVKGNCIQCPLHGWRFNEQGSCEEIPLSGDIIPDFAKLQSYPVQERHGVAYFFYGKEALFPLPFFSEENEGDFFAHKGVDVFQETSWYGPVVNSFDINHFVFSHNRVPIKPSEYNYTKSPYHAQARHYYLMEGKFWFERLLKKLMGKKMTLEVEVWGGNIILAKSVIGSMQNFLICYCTPDGQNKGISKIFIYRKKAGLLANLLSRIILPIIAEANRKIFQDESIELKDAIIKEDRLHPVSDKAVKEYLTWYQAYIDFTSGPRQVSGIEAGPLGSYSHQ
jgi:nitrite reductase/ring-hydroxylating ferredoxin subunit